MKRAPEKEKNIGIPKPRPHLLISGLRNGDIFNINAGLNLIERKKRRDEEGNEIPETEDEMERRHKQSIKILKESRDMLLDIVEPILPKDTAKPDEKENTSVRRKMKEFREIAKKHTNGRQSESRRIRQTIREKIISHLDFLDQGKDIKDLEKQLSGYGTRVNAYLKELSKEYMPDYQGKLEYNSKVTTCNDIAKLLLMAHNSNLTDEIRRQAGVKVAMMIQLGMLEYKLDAQDTLSEIVSFFGESIFDPPEEGGKEGETMPMKIIASYNHDLKITEAKMMPAADFIKERHGKGKKITDVEVRKTTINGVEVFHYFTTRIKMRLDELVKLIRNGKAIEESDDTNGIKIVVENAEEWDIYFENLLRKMVNDIIENLEDKLKHTNDDDDEIIVRIESLKKAKIIAVREVVKTEDGKEKDNGIQGYYLSTQEGIKDMEEIKCTNAKEFFNKLKNNEIEQADKTLIIHSYKNSLDGSEFKGSDDASSAKYRVCKGKIEYIGSNGNHELEFQATDALGFMKEIFEPGICWAEYRGGRFFESGIDKIIFGNKLTEKEREKARKKYIKRVRQKNWNGDIKLKVLNIVKGAFNWVSDRLRQAA